MKAVYEAGRCPVDCQLKGGAAHRSSGSMRSRPPAVAVPLSQRRLPSDSSQAAAWGHRETPPGSHQQLPVGAAPSPAAHGLPTAATAGVRCRGNDAGARQAGESRNPADDCGPPQGTALVRGSSRMGFRECLGEVARYLSMTSPASGGDPACEHPLRSRLIAHLHGLASRLPCAGPAGPPRMSGTPSSSTSSFPSSCVHSSSSSTPSSSSSMAPPLHCWGLMLLPQGLPWVSPAAPTELHPHTAPHGPVPTLPQQQQLLLLPGEAALKHFAS
ncbi:uncharacterized protein LOC144932775 isoform X3 [Lampetra fluviatilis]